MDDISALQQMSDEVMKGEDQVFDIRPAVAWTNDIQRAILVEGAKHFRGQNPPRGAAISYWLKSAPAGDVRIAISDVTGREIRSLEGTKDAGLNRVPWDLTLGGAGRGGRGGGRGAAAAPAAPATAAPATAAPAIAAPATPAPQSTPAAPAQPGQAPAGEPAQTPTAAAPQRGAGGGGGGRGGFGPAVPAGSYLIKVTVGDKVIGQKTLVVEADIVQ
jgi:hypothetical protein